MFATLFIIVKWHEKSRYCSFARDSSARSFEINLKRVEQVQQRNFRMKFSAYWYRIEMKIWREGNKQYWKYTPPDLSNCGWYSLDPPPLPCRLFIYTLCQWQGLQAVNKNTLLYGCPYNSKIDHLLQCSNDCKLNL